MTNPDLLCELADTVEEHDPDDCRIENCVICNRIAHLRKILFVSPGALPVYPYSLRADLKNSVSNWIKAGDDKITIMDKLNESHVFSEVAPDFTFDVSNVVQLFHQLFLESLFESFAEKRNQRF